MKFQHYDLGQLSGGEIVQITISGNAVNVRLMDSSNFSNYRNGRRHSYIGGHATKSPVRLQIPRSGHWHIALDLGGYGGSFRSGIRVLPGALPNLREVPLSSVPSLVRRGDDDIPPESSDQAKKEYDVFISHASEDKDAIVRELAHALQTKNLDVWFDEFELKIGDSLRRKIDIGLSKSKFGIVVLSKAFFNKGWTNYELDGLVTRANTGEQILLPIWHNITKQEVINYSPSLADKLARSTATHTVEEIAEEIFEVIKGNSL
jgi:uncharacterized protein DUF1883/TIR domain-containing protein